MFQIFLDQFAQRTKATNKRIVLIVDNASWHHASHLNWHHITLMYLPAYSSDFNPIERLWLVLKNRFFANWFTRDPNELMNRVCEGLKSLIDSPAEVASICAMAQP